MEPGILNEGIHAGEDSVVECVQHAETELEGVPFRHLEFLQDADVGDVEFGVLQWVAGRVTEGCAKDCLRLAAVHDEVNLALGNANKRARYRGVRLATGLTYRGQVNQLVRVSGA